MSCLDRPDGQGSKIGAPRREVQPRLARGFLIRLLPFVPPAVAGASCLPAIYHLVRTDRFVAAFCVIVVVGVLGGVFSVAAWTQGRRPRLLHLSTALFAGALASQACGFARYYITVGYRDPELALGILGSALELGGIALVGAAATCVGVGIGRLLWCLDQGDG